ncbi:10457_t:CDS:2 [Ambispora leptoticha]|uniref:10457_t:CDS:1 n=1 Tax=Ambispora leptoticha TaxID=144679 RepID=A0A9N8WDF8_9GLOM|nr:10457_t:CDS:2 [Ambispora leptoticha]
MYTTLCRAVTDRGSTLKRADRTINKQSISFSKILKNIEHKMTVIDLS